MRIKRITVRKVLGRCPTESKHYVNISFYYYFCLCCVITTVIIIIIYEPLPDGRTIKKSKEMIKTKIQSGDFFYDLLNY